MRTRTFTLLAPLDEAGMHRSADPIMSPPVWDLGHIAAYEELWLVRRLTGAPSLHPELETLYDAFETPRAQRNGAPILDEAAARRYLARVRERALDALDACDLSPDGPALTAHGFVFDMVAQHEAQHTETVLQALQLLPAGGYAPPRLRALRPAERGSDGRVVIPAGPCALGAGPVGFTYDCERPRHEQRLEAFAIDRFPVTNGQHLAFMADRGYERPELWTREGWAWRSAAGIQAPLYWTRDAGGGWLSRSFDRIAPVDPALPLCHVSWYEADAHARWAGGRLPTEAEWERAATPDPEADTPAEYPWGEDPVDGRANLDQLAFGPAPVGAFPDGESPTGAAQLIGDVWEWTATPFAGYPGFRAFPYREYAEVFFGERYRVLRGGSWATQPHAARTTFRNWDLPERRQIFAGFRCAWDVG